MNGQRRLSVNNIVMIVASVLFIAIGLWAGRMVLRDAIIAPWRAHLAGQGDAPWFLTACLLGFFALFLSVPVRMVVGALRAIHKSEEAIAAEKLKATSGRAAEAHSSAAPYRSQPRGDGVDRYRPSLSSLPFPKIEAGPGRQLPFLLAASASAQKTKKSNLFVGIPLALFGSVACVVVLRSGSISGALMTLPLLAAAVFVLWPWIRPLLAHALLDPVVEIDGDLVAAGKPFRVFVEQPGPARVTRLKVRLLCTEHVTYSRGTETYHEAREVNTVELGEELALEIPKGAPFIRTFEAKIPVDSMHSFESGNNRVEWAVRVEAEIDNWPDVKQTYPFAVLPAA